tara:strand:- start:2136 stop:2633 length:498 start_codon:yes stop_codon:yes gene_type:complete
MKKILIFLSFFLFLSCTNNESVDDNIEELNELIIGEWEHYFYEFDINGDGLNWDTRDMLAVYGYRDIWVFKNGNKWDWIDGRGSGSSSNNGYDGDYEINGTTLIYTNSNDKTTRTGYDLTFLCSNNVMRYRVETIYNDGTKRNTYRYYNKKGFDPWTCDIDYYSN